MPNENNVAAQAGDEPIYCPFCGDAESQTVKHVEGTIVHPAYFVECNNCGAVGPTSDRGDHRQLWNARVSPRATADVERDKVLEEAAAVCDDKHHTWRWDDTPDSNSGPRDCAAGIRSLKSVATTKPGA